MSKSAAKSPLSWIFDMLWISLRYCPTSTRGLNFILLLSKSLWHIALHFWSPSTEPASAVSLYPKHFSFSFSSSSSQSSNEAYSLRDTSSFSSAKANILDAPLPPAPLRGWMEQDSGRYASRESKNWNICNWLHVNKKKKVTFHKLLHNSCHNTFKEVKFVEIFFCHLSADSQPAASSEFILGICNFKCSALQRILISLIFSGISC